MDVVLTPIDTADGAWSLRDRLGRHLGEITKSEKSGTFVITTDPSGALRAVQAVQASLNEAMSAIAKVSGGACTLDSQDWISRGASAGPRNPR